MIEVPIEEEAMELLERIAAREGVSVAALVIRVCGQSLLGLDARTFERVSAIEEAADLVPGSLLDSFVAPFEAMCRDAEELFAWINDGWELTGPNDEIRGKLETLVARWRSEEATGNERKRDESPAEVAAREKLLAEIIASDRPVNERAMQLRENMGAAREKGRGGTYLVHLTASEDAVFQSVLVNRRRRGRLEGNVTPEAWIEAAVVSALHSAVDDESYRETIREEASDRATLHSHAWPQNQQAPVRA